MIFQHEPRDLFGALLQTPDIGWCFVVQTPHASPRPTHQVQPENFSSISRFDAQQSWGDLGMAVKEGISLQLVKLSGIFWQTRQLCPVEVQCGIQRNLPDTVDGWNENEVHAMFSIVFRS